MRKLSLRTTLVAGGVIFPAIILFGLFLTFYFHEKNSAIDSAVAKSRILATTVESTRDEMEDKWKQGLFTIEELQQWVIAGEHDKVLSSVPVVSAWSAAMRKADQGNYVFKVPKFHPRNSKNTPDELESEALETMKKNNLNEFYTIDEKTNTVHYFRAVILSDTCLYCHGNPADSQKFWGNSQGNDPTGTKMENWKTGEMHGAFEIIYSLNEANAALASTLSWSALLLICLLAILGITIALFTTRAVINPVRNAMNMLIGLEQGNLTTRIETKRTDEVGILAQSLNRFADNLQGEILEAFKRLAKGDFSFEAKGLISKPLKQASEGLTNTIRLVTDSSEQITAGAIQVAETSSSLANGATQQAAALEEISASMVQMNEQTSNNAANATAANKLSIEARDAAQKGNNQMQSMVQAMDEIKTSSHDISKIIKVIDEIAFQTNLLALNAAVEAARAGQHGKGFAVVAEEVRNLAARSSKAAQETTALIQGSVEKTNNGAEIAQSTATSLAEIVADVTKVSDLVAEIAAASQEQSQGISQVNEGLVQLNDVNQRATSTSEECAAIAEQLSGQTNELMAMMSSFTLLGTTPQRMAPPTTQTRQLPAQRKKSSAPALTQPTPAKVKKSQPESGGWETMNSTKPVIKLDDDDFGKY